MKTMTDKMNHTSSDTLSNTYYHAYLEYWDRQASAYNTELDQIIHNT